MRPITTTIEIDRPIDDVFNYMTDLNNAPEWATELVDVRYEGHLQAGATGTDVRMMGRKRLEMPWKVTRFEPPTIAVFEYGAPFPATAVFSFEPTTREGTRMTCRTELRPRGSYRLLVPLIAREAAATDKAQFQNVKSILEAQHNSRLLFAPDPRPT